MKLKKTIKKNLCQPELIRQTRDSSHETMITRQKTN